MQWELGSEDSDMCHFQKVGSFWSWMGTDWKSVLELYVDEASPVRGIFQNLSNDPEGVELGSPALHRQTL